MKNKNNNRPMVISAARAGKYSRPKSTQDSAARTHIRGFPMQFRPFPFDISPFFSFFAPSKQYSETYEHENN